jgi:outer membrane lipoprotein-sorting protein
MSARPLIVLCALFALSAPAVAAAAAPARPAAAQLSAADQALVDRAARYLDSLKQERARFVQTDARGQVTQGELYLDRPGKARFEYDKPATLLVISDGHTVGVTDSRLRTVDRYPLSSTPLALFLQKRVTLDNRVEVTDVRRVPGGFSLIMVDGRRKAPGQLTLTFSEQPMSLREWQVVDAQGGRTSVRISDLRPVSGLSARLFQLPEANPYPIH